MKVEFHTPMRPRSTGIFSRSGAVKKCSSISCAPSRKVDMTSYEYCKESGTIPTALHTEKRPPTQFQNPKIFSSDIPNATHLSIAVDTAMTCLLVTSPASVTPFVARSSKIHFLAVRAFNIVSAVVNVLLITTIRVSSGSRSRVQSSKSTGSTFARKRRVRPSEALAAEASARSASLTNSGPSCDPPMPTQTKFFNGLPVAPTCFPDLTLLVNASILSRTACTSSRMAFPSGFML
mmetsp:Transcript_26976/g.33297  ORF Transcript_26976/g.33297 Transcript_26976/m.33297 type:complete len:235 (+) Transcript_26976:784-1488(+)